MRFKLDAKKLLLKLMLSTVLLTSATPTVISFAAEGAGKQIEEKTETLIDEITTAEQYKQLDTDGTEDEESTTLRDKLVSDLKTKLGEIGPSENDSVNIQEGVRLIGEICNTNNAPSKVTQIWRENFKEQAEALGIPNNEIASWTGINISKYNENRLDTVKDSAEKINLLTWSGTGRNGLMMSMMQTLDSQTGAFSEYLIGIGLTLCVSFSCLSLSELVADRKFSQEAFMTTILKMCIGLWVIYNYRPAVGFIVYWGGELIDKFSTVLGDTDVRYAMYKNALAASLAQTVLQLNPIAQANSSFMTNLGNVAGSAFLSMVGGFALANPITVISGGVWKTITEWTGEGIVNLVSSFTIYSIIVEIMVRAVFTPIAIADMYNDTLRTSAFKYLKKIAALCMTGVVMYMMIFACDALKTNMGATGFWAQFDVVGKCAINMTMMGMMARARSIAEDIIGAH